jgi:CubicO group peptidase (beta-lactamase class C family)
MREEFPIRPEPVRQPPPPSGPAKALPLGLPGDILRAMRKPCCALFVVLIAGFAGFAGVNVQADKIDDFVAGEIREHQITGLSLAIIEDGKICKAQGYGFTDQSGNAQVTTATLFQAGSISKSVAALGALHLVGQGKLALDADVNTELRSWRIPENEFTKEKQVTLRRILSHGAGLTVHGFPGYAVDAAQPTLAQVLDGIKPANTAPVRVDIKPGSKWRYSGGGYTVMQQMVIDVTGRPFPGFMAETVLEPLGMTASTYEQPLPKDRAASAATGHHPDGKAIEGKWHVYPEMAAAGLWTTASDLARFAISVQQSLAGKTNLVISQAMTREMMTPAMPGDGLGVFLAKRRGKLWFSHDGRDAGFDASMMASAATGQGAVIMINLNDNSGAVKRIMEAISKEYHWQGHP